MSSRSELIPAARGHEPATTEAGSMTAAMELPVTRRPDPALLTYYFLGSLLLGPFFFALLIPSYFKYRSMRYFVEEEGITMRWGVLFRREISLNYSRIQDIHLSSNFIERWMGLAKIQVQTASGSSSAEMTIEGLHDFESVRDFLYTRMRGARGRAREGERALVGGTEDPLVELAATLNQIAAEMRALRLSLPQKTDGGGDA